LTVIETWLEAALAHRTANKSELRGRRKLGHGSEDVETKTREHLLLSATTIQMMEGLDAGRQARKIRRKGKSK
jgi:hypothetical protein